MSGPLDAAEGRVIVQDRKRLDCRVLWWQDISCLLLMLMLNSAWSVFAPYLGPPKPAGGGVKGGGTPGRKVPDGGSIG